MKVCWCWLLELVDLDRAPTVSDGAAALTRVGVEVEAMTDLGAGFAGVVVAEVVGKKPHPAADKLTLVDVITSPGGPSTQVVCGAPNVPAAGRRVLWARPGATLPNGLTLGVKAVKGIESPGMLCSEIELGVGDDESGIVVLGECDRTALGAPAQVALGVDDWMLELNAPANRPDLLGHLGVARELACALGGRVVPPPSEIDRDLVGDVDAAELCHVAIDDAEACPRYVARVIDRVAVGPSPRKLAQRLRAVGVRPINNLVDVTNYVLFELGQPLHAFDHVHVAGARIIVRRAKDGERMTTLDNQQRVLVGGDVVICDRDRPVALAGVMGGLESEVSSTTTRILLESASFQPIAIRRTARRLNLHSEASHRFERGVDPELSGPASVRAASLLARHGGGVVARGVVDAYPLRRTPAPIALRMPRFRAVTGVELGAADAAGALRRLGFDATDGAGDQIVVTPPSARADVVREVDVIEEVIRVHGFEHVPATLPALRAAPPVLVGDRADRVRRILAGAGLSEAITFGFTSLDRLAAMRLAASDRRNLPIPLRNPMTADQAIMRTSLVPNLVAAIARNRSFGRADVTLFEVGSVFLRRSLAARDDIRELADEPVWAAVVLSGTRPAQLGRGSAWDFFDAKAIAERVLAEVAPQSRPRFVATRAVTYLHPGVAAEIQIGEPGDDPIGVVGEVHPETRLALGVDAPVFVVELALDRLPPPAPRQMRPIPRYPAATRDVSLLVAEDVVASRVRDVIDGARQPLVEAFEIVEDYRDPKLPPNTKSMLWSLRYRSLERTLTDAEVDAAHEAIVAELVSQLPAQRR
jgi:phenylalanyl-tRNA synthetase beta chain